MGAAARSRPWQKVECCCCWGTRQLSVPREERAWPWWHRGAVWESPCVLLPLPHPCAALLGSWGKPVGSDFVHWDRQVLGHPDHAWKAAATSPSHPGTLLSITAARRSRILRVPPGRKKSYTFQTALKGRIKICVNGLRASPWQLLKKGGFF